MKVILDKSQAIKYGTGAADTWEPVGIFEEKTTEGHTTAIFRVHPPGKYFAVTNGLASPIDGRLVRGAAGLIAGRKKTRPASLKRIAAEISEDQLAKLKKICSSSTAEAIRMCIDAFEQKSS